MPLSAPAGAVAGACPSFVEACLGSRQTTPGAAAIEQAHRLLTRLIASGTVVPLNLLGTVGEQPDFLAHTEALPFVLALRADADWKHAPQKSSGHKVSPLVLELWKILDKEGALTAGEARETLGRELTEAAVLRALCELWQALRVSPSTGGGRPACAWEMLRVRHREALETGSTTSQVTASHCWSPCTCSRCTRPSSEEIEIFLSPVASRSRVREAVRGLSATRQIHSLSMDAQTYYFLENGLPEFAELAAPSSPAETDAPARPWRRDRGQENCRQRRPQIRPPRWPLRRQPPAPISAGPNPAPGPAPKPRGDPARGRAKAGPARSAEQVGNTCQARVPRPAWVETGWQASGAWSAMGGKR